jgi:hypothetical protein
MTMFVKAITLTRGEKCMVIMLPDNPGMLMTPENATRVAAVDIKKSLNRLMDQHKVGLKFRDMSSSHGGFMRIVAFHAYMTGVDLGVTIERIVLTEKP